MNPTREQREDQGVSLTQAWFRPSHQGSSCRAAANCLVTSDTVRKPLPRKVAELTFNRSLFAAFAADFFSAVLLPVAGPQ